MKILTWLSYLYSLQSSEDSGNGPHTESESADSSEKTDSEQASILIPKPTDDDGSLRIHFNDEAGNKTQDIASNRTVTRNLMTNRNPLQATCADTAHAFKMTSKGGKFCFVKNLCKRKPKPSWMSHLMKAFETGKDVGFSLLPMANVMTWKKRKEVEETNHKEWLTVNKILNRFFFFLFLTSYVFAVFLFII